MRHIELQPRRRTKMERDEARVRAGFWDKVRTHARRLPFLEDAVAAYYCAFDRSTPLHAKAILLGALAYFILPLDLIPDFAATLGFADDAAVLFGAIRAVSNNVTETHRLQARRALDDLLGPREVRQGPAPRR